MMAEVLEFRPPTWWSSWPSPSLAGTQEVEQRGWKVCFGLAAFQKVILKILYFIHLKGRELEIQRQIFICWFSPVPPLAGTEPDQKPEASI